MCLHAKNGFHINKWCAPSRVMILRRARVASKRFLSTMWTMLPAAARVGCAETPPTPRAQRSKRQVSMTDLLVGGELGVDNVVGLGVAAGGRGTALGSIAGGRAGTLVHGQGGAPAPWYMA